MADQAKPYKVLVPLNDTPEAWHSLDHAVQLVRSLKLPYRLLLVYIVALNPPQSLPYLDHLDKAANLEIQSKAEREIEACKEKLADYEGLVSYELIEVEGEGEVGPVIEAYVTTTHPDCDMVVVGSRNLQGIRKWILGSVSEYLLQHLAVPVTVVKNDSTHRHAHGVSAESHAKAS